MGRHFTPNNLSPYYPPRARWYSRFFVIRDQLRRRLALDRLHMPLGMTLGGLLAGCAVPGLAVYLRGPRFWGQVAMAASFLLLLIYAAGLGHSAANLALGILISLHTTGLAYYCHPLVSADSFRSRLTFTLLILLGLMFAIYLPARDLVQRHWLIPLQMDKRVIVVRRMPPPVLQRGDLAAYSWAGFFTGDAHRGGAVRAEGGVGFGPVLAVGGDQVSFATNAFFINGVRHPLLAHMPLAGGFVVPEKHWFIWPNLAISGHGNVTEQTISDTLARLADVAPDQYLGQPFHRWFGREQIPP